MSKDSDDMATDGAKNRRFVPPRTGKLVWRTRNFRFSKNL